MKAAGVLSAAFVTVFNHFLSSISIKFLLNEKLLLISDMNITEHTILFFHLFITCLNAPSFTFSLNPKK